MKRLRFLGTSIGLMMLLVACTKDNPNVSLADYHYDYFPVKLGAYWMYDVVEISHDQNAAVEHDTISYQLKTEIGDTLIDNEGRITNRFYRYKRNTSFDSWVLTDVWTTILVDNRAELVDENIRKVVLRFPIKANMVWNPNQFNFLASQQAYYEDIHNPNSVSGFSLDSTVKALSVKELSLVSYAHQYEVYSKKIGLVRKYYKDLKISNFDTLNILSGKELYYTLTDYSH
jgi:hypothetical protein